MWLFDTKRGSDPSRFSPGCFYVDGTQGKYFCKASPQNGAPTAVLTRFGTYPVLGRMMLDISVNFSVSALYLEVKNLDELAALQRDFASFISHPPVHRATPDELGIKIDSGPEGSYTTALLRLKS